MKKKTGLLLACGWLGLSVAGSFADEAVLFFDSSDAQIRFCSADLKNALEGKGYHVSEKPLTAIEQSTEALRVIVGLKSDPALAASEDRESMALPQQGYTVRLANDPHKSIWITGGDATGAMYGGLDCAELIRQDGVDSIKAGTHTPYLESRAIKINVPLDARTPSFSDEGDQAWNAIPYVWDFSFWTNLLDQMARNHFNLLSLWNLNPFPSMVNVPDYPEVSLADVKMDAEFSVGKKTPNAAGNLKTVRTMTMAEKIAFWQKVMQYGKDRGVDFYMYLYGVYSYGIDPSTGITADMSNAKTKDYLRKATCELIKTYPLLAGLGLTPGMNLKGKPAEREQWLWETYGLGIQDALAQLPGRKININHRLNGTSIGEILKTFGAYPQPLEFSTKYVNDHMYTTTRSSFADKPVSQIPAGSRFRLEFRQNSIFTMRWGDPGFVRDFFRNVPQRERLIGYDFGADGYTWIRDFFSVDPDARQTWDERHWYAMKLWGRLGYDPDLPDGLFQKALAERFPATDAVRLCEAWAAASKIVPLISRFYYIPSDYEWYPEACYSNPKKHGGFHTVRDFIGKHPPMKGEGLIGIKDYCTALQENKTVTGTTPLQVAQQLNADAAQALALIEPLKEDGNKELGQTLADIRAMALLGNYYSEKISGAVALCTYDISKKEADHAAAVGHLKTAAEYWQAYAELYHRQYRPQVFPLLGLPAVDLNEITKSVLADVDLATGGEL